MRTRIRFRRLLATTAATAVLTMLPLAPRGLASPTGTVPAASWGTFTAPTSGYIGLAYSASHNGLDIWPTKGTVGCGGGSSATPGNDVHPVRAGKIFTFWAGDHSGHWWQTNSPTATHTDAAGNAWPTSVVVVAHTGVPGFEGTTLYTRYEHLAVQADGAATTPQAGDRTLINASLAKDQDVTTSTLLGAEGNWRYSAGNDLVTHLHLSVDTDELDNAKRLFYDPQPFLGVSYGSCSMAALGSPAPAPAKSLDLAFAIDTTGSMGDDIASAKAVATSILSALKAQTPDTRVAVTDFRDFPSRTGYAGDYPYRDDQGFTSDMAAATAAITSLDLGYGGDAPETRYCALMHIITATNCAGQGASSSVGRWRASPTSKAIVYLTDAPALSPEPFTNYSGATVVSAGRAGGLQFDPVYFGEAQDPTMVLTGSVPALGPAAVLAAEAEEAGIAIYPIVIGSDPTAIADSQELADGTGGRLFTAASADDVAAAIEEAIGTITGGDTTPPVITIGAPTASTYLLNASVATSYGCADESAVASCAGPAPSGAPLDTTSVGVHSFTVEATDTAGNAGSKTVVYTVAYDVRLIGDPSKPVKAGSVIPIKLRLVDASGVNVSSAAVTLTAAGLVPAGTPPASNAVRSPGRANPGGVFRYDPTLRGYVFNLSTKGLAPGAYNFAYTAGGDPTTHVVPIQVR